MKMAPSFSGWVIRDPDVLQVSHNVTFVVLGEHFSPCTVLSGENSTSCP